MAQRAMISNMFNQMRKMEGISLTEVMIALVVLLLVFLGIMQAATLSIDNNLRNLLREEAISLAADKMNELKSETFNDNLNRAANGGACGAGNSEVVAKDFRNLTKNYTVCSIVQVLDGDTLTIQVVVGWDHKNENAKLVPTNKEFQHAISTLRRRQ